MSTMTAPAPSPLMLRAWDRPDPRPMDPHPTVLAPSLMLEVTIVRHSVTITVTGDLCRGACHELTRLGERLFLDGATAVTVDLADVTLVDADGLRQLRRVVELADLCAAPARIVGASPSTARVLDVAGLAHR